MRPLNLGRKLKDLSARLARVERDPPPAWPVPTGPAPRLFWVQPGDGYGIREGPHATGLTVPSEFASDPVAALTPDQRKLLDSRDKSGVHVTAVVVRALQPRDDGPVPDVLEFNTRQSRIPPHEHYIS